MANSGVNGYRGDRARFQVKRTFNSKRSAYFLANWIGKIIFLISARLQFGDAVSLVERNELESNILQRSVQLATKSKWAAATVVSWTLDFGTGNLSIRTSYKCLGPICIWAKIERIGKDLEALRQASLSPPKPPLDDVSTSSASSLATAKRPAHDLSVVARLAVSNSGCQSAALVNSCQCRRLRPKELTRKLYFPYQYAKYGTVRHRSPKATENDGISDGICRAGEKLSDRIFKQYQFKCDG